MPSLREGGTPARPMYTINDGGTAGDDLPGVADDMTTEAQDMLESLL